MNVPHFWTGLLIWDLLALLFGLALWLGMRITGIEIGAMPFAFVVVISSLATLVPGVGQFLCYAIAVFLIYRLTDAEFRHVIITVAIARGLVIILCLGFYSYIAKERQAKLQQYQAKQLQMILNSQMPTNSANPVK